jgi:hypothetical protein
MVMHQVSNALSWLVVVKNSVNLLLIHSATVTLNTATSVTGEVGVTVVQFCVLFQVPKNKMLDRHLEKQEENTLDKLEKKACSLQKVSVYHHQ